MTPSYSLVDLVLYFFRLGTVGFGGPVALVGYMHRDLVIDRRWISEEDYREGMALAQLSPGPLAAQLGIYLGYVHYGILGATLTGLAFVIPSFFMVLIISIAYGLYGGLPWMQAIFYGVGASVIGIIAVSAWKLTVKSVGQINVEGLRKNWLLWLFYLVAGLYTFISEREEVWVFVAAGLIYMFVKAPPRWFSAGKSSMVFLFFGGVVWSGEPGILWKIALFFTEAGAFVFGSGLAIVPFLHGGVVQEFGWLTEKEFLDAVAVAMITPGPVVITVGFIGYLVAGVSGACVAAVATFLPCYLFTVLPAPYFKKYAKDTSIKAFVDGITAAVIGALTGAVVVIASRSIIDIPTAGIALCTALALVYLKKVPEYYFVLASAAIGFLIKTV
ncbi:MAG TPA: chromate transporter [Saprospiraceae bacterium]|nr:chromate transporter [Saprospiraceae bacterium]HOY07174.1 chromate transporter [Saprospiraceae bacterium]HPI07857.1 chromate transporter [Saprospiraceae bacterium]